MNNSELSTELKNNSKEYVNSLCRTKPKFQCTIITHWNMYTLSYQCFRPLWRVSGASLLSGEMLAEVSEEKAGKHGNTYQVPIKFAESWWTSAAELSWGARETRKTNPYMCPFQWGQISGIFIMEDVWCNQYITRCLGRPSKECAHSRGSTLASIVDGLGTQE